MDGRHFSAFSLDDARLVRGDRPLPHGGPAVSRMEDSRTEERQSSGRTLLCRLGSGVPPPRRLCRGLGAARHQPRALGLKPGQMHWFLRNAATGEIVDPTEGQFPSGADHSAGKGCGFLTEGPSRRAREIGRRLGSLPFDRGLGPSTPPERLMRVSEHSAAW